MVNKIQSLRLCTNTAVMFEKINNITISGGYFDQATTLDLLDSNQPLSIVYGRNGSAKR